jgi:hypothetical protein
MLRDVENRFLMLQMVAKLIVVCSGPAVVGCINLLFIEVCWGRGHRRPTPSHLAESSILRWAGPSRRGLYGQGPPSTEASSRTRSSAKRVPQPKIDKSMTETAVQESQARLFAV